METYVTGTDQKIAVHDAIQCSGHHCPIHNPSDHHMKEWPTHWRPDIRIMERICPHGVGHPDPDCKYAQKEGYNIHGCDGCCKGDNKKEKEQT